MQDYEPAFALRKIALLYEKKLNEEVAHVIREISLGTLRKIYGQFPIDMFIEGIPHTLSIVSILYSRLLSSVSDFFTFLSMKKYLDIKKKLSMSFIKILLVLFYFYIFFNF